MSFIIGAGFSKNISNTFPLWGELLRPMILEMYPECLYKNTERTEVAIQNIVSKKGYLEIASEYVRRKGYHEAIDVYIEKHTPYLLKQQDDSWDIMLDGKTIDTQPYLECHKKLLSLDVKHIYTFNYDNALDVLGDTQVSEAILKKQENANLLLTQYEDIKKSYQECFDSLNNPIGVISIEPQETATSNTFDTLLNKANETIKTFGVKLNLKLFAESTPIKLTYDKNIAILDNKIAEQKGLSDSAAMKRGEVYQLITNSFHISLTENNKNIYKLHGNLRLPDSKDFGFDHDAHKQYVITKEDYEEYPNKHDAFVNLMKISLLKGNFCIVGFSCDDPNFLMWINWVKDVLDKSKPTRNYERDIYFINVGNEPISDDKLLLLRNHYITPINLYSLFPSAKDETERMFDFLSSIEMDKGKYDDYNNAWSKIKIDYNNKRITDEALSHIEKLYKLTPYNRIPSQTYSSHYQRTEIFSSIKALLGQNQYPAETAKLIYAAIKGELMPINAVLDHQKIKQLSKLKIFKGDLKVNYSLLAMRACILQHRSAMIMKNAKEESTYECIWGKLFMFRFDEARQLLNDWCPTNAFNCTRKIMLSSLFDSSEIQSETIISLLNRDKFNCFQDYRYALDILPQSRGIIFEDKNGHISLDEDVRILKDTLDKNNPYLTSWWKTTDVLLENICKQDDKTPYGNIKKSHTFGSYNTKLVNATKILQILIELGLSTKTRNLIFIDKNKWISICEVLYEYYPYPCLYFTLLYGNSKDIICKIAQNYIYSTNLYSILPNLLNEMMQASLDSYCPSNIKNAIYIVAPIFMQAVAPEKWFDSFRNIYESFDFSPTNPNRDRINSDYDFFIKGLELTHNIEFKKKVIMDCLNKQSEVDNFYNELMIAASSGISEYNGIANRVSSLMDKANTPAQFYVLLNMRQYINNDELCKKFFELPDKEYGDFTLLSGVVWFAKDYPQLQMKLSEIVINSPLLWRTGISDDRKTISYYGSTLDINTIQNNINFSDDQIKMIYNKMLSALNAVSDVTQKKSQRQFDMFDDWTSILIIMIQFMRKNQNILRELPTYNDTRKKARSLYNQNRGGDTISDLLIDDSRTNNAIESLVNNIIIIGVSKYQYEYTLIANKIIMRNSQYLNSCFKHFAWALTEYKDQFKQDVFKPLLKSILDSYQPYFLTKNAENWDIQHAEKNVVEKELINIYKVYIQWGCKSTFWTRHKPMYYYTNKEQ